MANHSPIRFARTATLAALLLGAAALGGSPGEARAERAAADGTWERLAATPGAGQGEEIRVHTRRAADGTVQVEAALAVAVSEDVVRAVLTDYENMPRFVPDIVAARVIGSDAGSTRVEIEGVARLLFMDFPITTTVDAVTRRDGSIAIDSVAGNLAIHASVRVQGDDADTRVD